VENLRRLVRSTGTTLEPWQLEPSNCSHTVIKQKESLLSHLVLGQSSSLLVIISGGPREEYVSLFFFQLFYELAYTTRGRERLSCTPLAPHRWPHREVEGHHHLWTSHNLRGIDPSSAAESLGDVALIDLHTISLLVREWPAQIASTPRHCPTYVIKGPQGSNACSTCEAVPSQGDVRASIFVTGPRVIRALHVFDREDGRLQAVDIIMSASSVRHTLHHDSYVPCTQSLHTVVLMWLHSLCEHQSSQAHGGAAMH
jgi:hypothetical protein